MTAPDCVSSLRALADATRLALARLLLDGPFNVGEIQEVFDLGQSTASHHLKILTDAGLLSCRREGRLAYYQWSTSLPPALESLRAFVRQHAPAFDPDARRRLHQVFEARADRTRRFFEGPGLDAVVAERASERPSCNGADVVGTLLAHIRTGARVADLGTGAGRLLGALRSRASRVIGVDASPRMLENADRVCRESGWTDVELRLGTLEHLPLRDAEVDVAVAHQVIHHAAQPAVVLAEALRALKPGGELIIADFLPHDREWMREELADQWLGFDPEAFARTLAEAGFEAVEVSRHAGSGGELGMFVASGRRPQAAAPFLNDLAGDRAGLQQPKPARASPTVRRLSNKAPRNRSAARGDKS